MVKNTFIVLLLASILDSPGATAQDTNPNCATPLHYQLDFWLGEWDVYNAHNAPLDTSAQQEPVAQSRIESILGGCVIQEHYRADTGYAGTSLNRFDAAMGHWVQHWMDNVANGIDFIGHLNGNTIVFEAIGLKDANGSFNRRMQLTSVSADEVQQHSDRSYDQGQTWFPEYRLIYRRKAHN